MNSFTISPHVNGKAYVLSGGSREALPYPLWFVDLENAIAYAEQCAGDRGGEVTLLNEAGQVLEKIAWKVAKARIAKFHLLDFLRSIPRGIFAFRLAATESTGSGAPVQASAA